MSEQLPSLEEVPEGLIAIGAALLILVGSLMAHSGLVKREYLFRSGSEVTRNSRKVFVPHRPHEETIIRGPEAVRIGWGSLTAAAAGVIILVNCLCKRWLWHLRVIAAMAFLIAATLLCFPPRPWEIPGFAPSFYGFLGPALIGAAFSGRSVWAGAPLGGYPMWVGVIVGAGVSTVLGRSKCLEAIFFAMFIFAYLGPHVRFLTSEAPKAMMTVEAMLYRFRRR